MISISGFAALGLAIATALFLALVTLTFRGERAERDRDHPRLIRS